VRCIIGEVHAIPGTSAEQLFTQLDGFHVGAERVHNGRGPFIASRDVASRDWTGASSEQTP